MKKYIGYAPKLAVAGALFGITAVATLWSPWSFVLFVLVAWLMFLRETRALARHAGVATEQLRIEQWTVGAGLAFAVGMRFISLQWTVAIGLSAVVTDFAANVVGLICGKKFIHLPYSEKSEKKSWEGAIGGFVGGTVAFVWVLFDQAIPGGLLTLVLLGMLAAYAATKGDLRQSGMKREYEVKDTANTLPGHGGVSERLDSISTAFIVVVAVALFAVMVWMLSGKV